MKISIRKFEGKDIPKKVEWINNSENNKYLHYDIPFNSFCHNSIFLRLIS